MLTLLHIALSDLQPINLDPKVQLGKLPFLQHVPREQPQRLDDMDVLKEGRSGPRLPPFVDVKLHIGVHVDGGRGVGSENLVQGPVRSGALDAGHGGEEDFEDGEGAALGQEVGFP